MKLRELVAAFLTHERLIKRIRPTSEKTYAFILNHFAKSAGHNCQDTEAAKKIGQYLSERGQCLGDHAFNKTFQVLRAMFDFGQVPSILTGATAPPVHDHERVFLTERQVEDLLQATEQSGRYHAIRDAAILGCLFYGLLRIGEALRLRPADVDLDNGEILVIGKGGHQRHIPMCARLSAILVKWVGHLNKVHPKSPVLFPSQAAYHATIGQLDTVRFEKVLREVYNRIVKFTVVVTPHTLRRSGADFLRRRGVALPVIQKLLGHQSITTTMKYLGVSLEELRAGVAAFDSLPCRATPPNHVMKTIEHGHKSVKRNFYRWR